jgi:hypothetical protein
MLELLARDQVSSLLRAFVNCGRKMFYNIGHVGYLQNFLRLYLDYAYSLWSFHQGNHQLLQGTLTEREGTVRLTS